jgi:hypothetical protein
MQTRTAGRVHLVNGMLACSGKISHYGNRTFQKKYLCSKGIFRVTMEYTNEIKI